jgi:hypothetical protein
MLFAKTLVAIMDPGTAKVISTPSENLIDTCKYSYILKMFEVKYLMAICVFEYAYFGKFSLAPGRIRIYKQHCALKFSGQSTPPSHNALSHVPLCVSF